MVAKLLAVLLRGGIRQRKLLCVVTRNSREVAGG